MKDFDGNAPYPRGASTWELAVLDRLARAWRGSRDQSHRDAIGQGVNLIVDLIEGRGKRPDFDPWDPPHGDD